MKRTSLALLAIASCAASPYAAAAGPCNADTIYHAGFESAAAVRINGVLGSLEAADIEVRTVAGVVLATGSATNGGFSIELPPLAPETMLELRARGLQGSGEEFIELASHLGTVQQLLGLADIDGVVRVAGAPGLRVSPTSTARYALTRQSFGTGEPAIAHECQLAAIDATLLPAEVLERAAVIKILIEDGTASATAAAKLAMPTTLETVEDPALLDAAITEIESNDPGRIASVEGLLAEVFCDYFAPEAISLLGQRAEGLVMNQSSGEIYQQVDASTGIHVNHAGSDGYAWTCSGDHYSLDFVGDRVAENFPFRDVNGVPTQVSARLRTLEGEIRWVDSGVHFITVAVHTSWEQTFPFNPELPTEQGSGETRLVLLRQAPGTPFDALTVPGEYLMPTARAIGDRVANRVRLDMGGDGMDLDANLPVTWNVVGGELRVAFADRFARILPIRDETADVRDVVALSTMDDGSRAISNALLLRHTATTQWNSEGGVTGTYVQNARRQAEPFYRLELNADRRSPSFTDYDSTGTIFNSAVLWWSNPQPGTVVLRVCEYYDGTSFVQTPLIDREPGPGECTSWYRRREWTLYSVDGDRLYMHEVNQDWYSDPTGGQAPDFDFSRAIHYLRPGTAVEPAAMEKAAGDEVHVAAGVDTALQLSQ